MNGLYSFDLRLFYYLFLFCICGVWSHLGSWSRHIHSSRSLARSQEMRCEVISMMESLCRNEKSEYKYFTHSKLILSNITIPVILSLRRIHVSGSFTPFRMTKNPLNADFCHFFTISFVFQGNIFRSNSKTCEQEPKSEKSYPKIGIYNFCYWYRCLIR